MRYASFFLAVALCLAACHRVEVERVVHPPLTSLAPGPDWLKQAIARLTPLHRPLRAPEGADWLAHHHEAGQTFQQYISGYPLKPTAKRNTIYVQPLGDLTAARRRIIRLTADFMARFYCLQMKVARPMASSAIPSRARRTHPTWGTPQVLTSYVNQSLLRPRLPEDAAAYIGITPEDLWPGRGWNFVFGMANLHYRVGVWSMYRFGDPEKDAASFTLALRRTLKLATHETGHMFTMRHCTAHQCNMSGRNSLEESDRLPLPLCPQCMAKVCWASRCDPVARLKSLLLFCLQNGLKSEAEFYGRSLAALGGK